MTAEKFQTAMQGTCKSCMSSFCLFITAHIISVVSFQNTLSEQFLFKDRFQFNLPCEDVKHASIGVEGLISCKFALFKLQENEELISEPAISLWGGARRGQRGYDPLEYQQRCSTGIEGCCHRKSLSLSGRQNSNLPFSKSELSF